MKLQRRMSLALALPVLAGLAGLAAPAAAQESNVRTAPWPEAVIEAAERLAVQDGGRVKPLYTYASFTLLRLHGKRSIKTLHDERLTPVEWLLDTLFFPAASSEYALFLVQNSEVIDAIGLSIEGKKRRDRYSFNELRPGLARLFQLANEYSALEEKDRTPVQQQVWILASNVDAFSRLITHMDFARLPIPLRGGELLTGIFDGRSSIRFVDVLANVGRLRELYEELAPGHGEEAPVGDAADFHGLSQLLSAASELTNGTESLALVPPAASREETEAWLSPSDLFLMGFQEGEIDPAHTSLLGSLDEIARNRNDPAGMRDSFETLLAAQTALAEARGELGKVGLELGYYKAKLIDRSLYAFVLAFLLTAFMWLRPKNRLLYWSTNGVVGVATLLVSVAIVVRCVIRGRPPVSTLYETVLFVTATGAMVALFVEAIGKRRIALSAAAILGTIGLFVANGYELLDKRDTMPSLVAVLDTNFWLATHVTSITLGYSAGMLAALLGSVYLLAKLVGWHAGDRAFYSSLGRMVYGVLCFGLIFSVVGTILGGIWANDSWGRFWGWDPKENGALLIVLSQLVILHGRMAGLLREHGVCMAAAFGGTIIAFSWWGVNLLGVGLHSYGFTSGIHTALWTYYTIQWGIVGLGAVAWLRERARSRAAVMSAVADVELGSTHDLHRGGTTA